MADIISFYAASRRVRKPAEPLPAGSGTAQLLFFTGVRYERRAAVEDKKPRKRKVAASHAPDAAIGS